MKAVARIILPIILGAFALAGCGPGASTTGYWVGKVDGTDAYVSVATDGSHAIAFVCDGTPEKLTLWAVFNGNAAGDSFSLTAANGIRLEVRLGSGSASGSVVLADGTRHTFSAEPAQDAAGIYRGTTTIEQVDYRYVWVVLNDGSERGGALADAPAATAKPPAYVKVKFPVETIKFKPGVP